MANQGEEPVDLVDSDDHDSPVPDLEPVLPLKTALQSLRASPRKQQLSTAASPRKQQLPALHSPLKQTPEATTSPRKQPPTGDN